MIDLHCHVLAGIDDGPGSVQASVDLARAAESAGIKTIVATPHVSSRYPNDAATIARLTDELHTRFAEEGLSVELVPGAEIALTRFIDIGARELPQLQLGSGGWFLLEPPFAAVGIRLDTVVLKLVERGHRIVMAHPERCMAFQREPQMLEELIGAGVLTSITAGSLAGQFGGTARRFAIDLARRGLIHNVASDAHDTHRRPPRIRSELFDAGLGALAGWLTEEVPAAILAGGSIPPRPPVSIAIDTAEPVSSPARSLEKWR